MTILTHVRRLKDERKFLEACKNLTERQVSSLERLRALVAEEPRNSPASIPKKQKKKQDSDEEVGTHEVMKLRVPGTPTDEELLKEALEESPVPARKKVLKQMKKPASCQVVAGSQRAGKPQQQGKGPRLHSIGGSCSAKGKKPAATKEQQAFGKDLKARYSLDSLVFHALQEEGAHGN